MDWLMKTRENARSPAGPRIVGKESIPTPWSGTFSEYRMFGGLFASTQAEVAWALPEGPFIYWRCRVTDFRTVE